MHILMSSLFCSSHVLLPFLSSYLFGFFFTPYFTYAAISPRVYPFSHVYGPLQCILATPPPGLSCYSHSCTLALFFVLSNVPVFARIYGLAWLRSRKILMQSPIPICSVTGLSSHEDIDALPSSHLQCDRAE